MSKRIGPLYTIRIMGPDLASPLESDATQLDKNNQEVIDSMGYLLGLTQDQLNNLLPEGYYCKIEE